MLAFFPPFPLCRNLRIHVPSVDSMLCKMHERTPLLGSTVPPPPPPPLTPRTATPEEPDPPRLNPVSLYTHFLTRHPLKTKMVTSSLLAGLSDIITQVLESTRSPRRVLSMAIAGGILTAPMFHYLYTYLEHIIPSTSIKGVAAHLLTDQLLAAPIWLILFLPLIPLLEGHSLRTAMTKTRRDFRPGLAATWSIFPLIQAVNFSVVPVKARVLVLNVTDLLYTSVLSWIMHREH